MFLKGEGETEIDPAQACRLRRAGAEAGKRGKKSGERGGAEEGGKRHALSLSLEIKELDAPDRGGGEAQRH